MKVFNLAEELEKERKKNKELEKGCKEYRYCLKQMRKMNDNCKDTIEDLQNKIDKAVEYIEYNACCLHDEEILKDLLDILKAKVIKSEQ